MKELDYTIRDEAGMHARPAGVLVKRMQGFKSEILADKGAKRVSLKKLFALMGLGIRQGETVHVTAEGEDEDEAIAAALEVMRQEGL
ncbi:MAG: HPr family phosphocarrier protein [Deltaproteobacteria bacterium]|jgi:phosphocarrier protein|nr:HPr family phosphocarrier protein [Deltaproteobacteria bacterium]